MKQEYARAYAAMPESKDVKKKPVVEASNDILFLYYLYMEWII